MFPVNWIGFQKRENFIRMKTVNPSNEHLNRNIFLSVRGNRLTNELLKRLTIDCLSSCSCDFAISTRCNTVQRLQNTVKARSTFQINEKKCGAKRRKCDFFACFPNTFCSIKLCVRRTTYSVFLCETKIPLFGLTHKHIFSDLLRCTLIYTTIFF